MVLLLSAGVATAAQRPAHAQPGSFDVRAEAFAGSEIERYLRLLQLQDGMAAYPWAIRSFSPAEVDRLLPLDSLHPWSSRYDFARDTVRRHVGILAPRIALTYNSAFPHGVNTGAVWTGRGLTTAVQAGLAARLGPLSITLAPIAFRAQNAEFELAPSAATDSLTRYRDPLAPDLIDRPQRFGADPLMRLDPSESTVRLDVLGATVGVSTAAQQWGPAVEYPLLLGSHGGGFPHAFAGTARPANLWIGRLHGRLVWGRLDQSAYSPSIREEGRRFMAGGAAVFLPRGVNGLEIGVARFYHMEWPPGGPGRSDFTRPLEALLKAGLIERGDPDARLENQLASVYFRWALPRNGFEVFGEFVRDDHSYDVRHFLLEPGDLSGYMVGFQKAWTHDAARRTLLRAEILNTETAHRGRNVFANVAFVPLYIHNDVRQGHTQRGRLLVPDAAFGGAGAVVAVDRYRPSGRWSLEWRREQRLVRFDTAPAVAHSLGTDVLLFLRGLELTAGATGVYEFNRYFADDAFNLNLRLRMRARL